MKFIIEAASGEIESYIDFIQDYSLEIKQSKRMGSKKIYMIKLDSIKDLSELGTKLRSLRNYHPNDLIFSFDPSCKPTITIHDSYIE